MPLRASGGAVWGTLTRWRQIWCVCRQNCDARDHLRDCFAISHYTNAQLYLFYLNGQSSCRINLTILLIIRSVARFLCRSWCSCWVHVSYVCVCVTFDQLCVRCQVYVRPDVHWTLCQSQAISTSTRLVHHLTLFQSDQEYSHCDKKLARSRAFSYWPVGPTSETNVCLAQLLGNDEIIHDFAMTLKFCLFSFFNDKFISPN